MLGKKKFKKFNLRKLETEALTGYKSFKEDNDQDSRTQLFNGIRELAFAILTVGDFEKYNIDVEESSYEYALYLFERILNGFELVPSGKGDKFPLQYYISLNIKDTVITKRDDELFKSLIGDMQFLIERKEVMEVEDDTDLESKIHHDYLANCLFKALRIFYTHDEIRRVLPISLELMFESKRKLIIDNSPTDIKDFSTVLISLAKRVIIDSNINVEYDIPKKRLEEIFGSSVRSSVFLAAVVDTNFFPKELLLSLDSDSLSRIVSLMGGKSIRIPTQRELDTLLGSVVTIAKMIMEGGEVKDLLKETKANMDLVYCNQKHFNVQTFISKSIETYNMFGEDPKTKPLINALISSIKSIETIIDQVVKENGHSENESERKRYTDLTRSFAVFSESLDSFIKPKTIMREL